MSLVGKHRKRYIISPIEEPLLRSDGTNLEPKQWNIELFEIEFEIQEIGETRSAAIIIKDLIYLFY